MIPETPLAHPADSDVTPSTGGAAEGGPPAGAAPKRGIAPPSRAELERVRAREPEALGALFDRYIGLVYGLAYRLMGERTLAEDVAQDVFLKVHRAAHQLDPAAWLSAITTNACRDVWRSGAYRMARSSHPVEEELDRGGSLTRGTNDPEDQALAAERERLVQDAIGRLPEVLRLPVVLHDYQGLGHAEIAAMLGIHPAAARKRYSRALAALAAMLTETLG